MDEILKMSEPIPVEYRNRYLRFYYRNKDKILKKRKENYSKQNGLCAICGNTEKSRRLAVDHCHKTGKNRGLLCSTCNTTLGRFNDDYNLLKKAIIYLKKYDKLNN